MRSKHAWPGLFPGLILVSLGAGLLAREFGLLPSHVRFVDFWPLLVVFFGISSLVRARGIPGALFALAVLALGGALLAGNLGFLAFPAARLWPGLLVLLGLAFLIGGFHRSGRHGPGGDPPSGARRGPRHGGDGGPAHAVEASDQDRLTKQITFSGAQFKIESQAWKGGELGVTLGGAELDLRNARLHPDGALLDVRVVMGGIEMRVPDTWQIQCEVTPFCGSAEDSTRSTQGPDGAPRLRIVGAVTLGGIEIRN